MAGFDLRIVRVLLRQATNAATTAGVVDPAAQKTFLNNLINGAFTEVQKGATPLISSTINGKSVTFGLVPGMTRADIMLAAETALEVLEAGLSNLPTTAVYRFPC